MASTLINVIVPLARRVDKFRHFMQNFRCVRAFAGSPAPFLTWPSFPSSCKGSFPLFHPGFFMKFATCICLSLKQLERPCFSAFSLEGKSRKDGWSTGLHILTWWTSSAHITFILTWAWAPQPKVKFSEASKWGSASSEAGRGWLMVTIPTSVTTLDEKEALAQQKTGFICCAALTASGVDWITLCFSFLAACPKRLSLTLWQEGFRAPLDRCSVRRPLFQGALVELVCT